MYSARGRDQSIVVQLLDDVTLSNPRRRYGKDGCEQIRSTPSV